VYNRENYIGDKLSVCGNDKDATRDKGNQDYELVGEFGYKLKDCTTHYETCVVQSFNVLVYNSSFETFRLTRLLLNLATDLSANHLDE